MKTLRGTFIVLLAVLSFGLKVSAQELKFKSLNVNDPAVFALAKPLNTELGSPVVLKNQLFNNNELQNHPINLHLRKRGHPGNKLIVIGAICAGLGLATYVTVLTLMAEDDDVFYDDENPRPVYLDFKPGLQLGGQALVYSGGSFIMGGYILNKRRRTECLWCYD